MPVDPTIVRDLVVVIPGIMGSELLDEKDNALWSVSPGALTRAIRTFGGSLRELALKADIGDHCPEGPRAIQPGGLLDSLHAIPGLWTPVVGYDGLSSFLLSHRFHLLAKDPGSPDFVPNFIPFAYDWRLSNRYNARRLKAEIVPALEAWKAQPGMKDAKLILICHSMGGLIARWFAEREGGAELIRAMITVATPHRGSINALNTLVNGVGHKIGPLDFSLTDFVRTLPSLYQLLPQYACINTPSGRLKITTEFCPALNQAMWDDACQFHADLSRPDAPRYPLYKIVGIRQPTATTGWVRNGKVELEDEIDGLSQGGDGTVAVMAAQPELGRGVEVKEAAGQHGELQVSRSALDLIDGILSRQEIIWQAVESEDFGVQMSDVWSTTDSPVLRVTGMNDRRMEVKLLDESGAVTRENIAVSEEGLADLGPLPEGGYRAVVATIGRGGPMPIAKPFLIFNNST